jgi:hypothetical protein
MYHRSTCRYILARLASLAFDEVEYVVIHSIIASDESSVKRNNTFNRNRNKCNMQSYLLLLTNINQRVGVKNHLLNFLLRLIKNKANGLCLTHYGNLKETLTRMFHCGPKNVCMIGRHFSWIQNHDQLGHYVSRKKTYFLQPCPASYYSSCWVSIRPHAVELCGSRDSSRFRSFRGERTSVRCRYFQPKLPVLLCMPGPTSSW